MPLPSRACACRFPVSKLFLVSTAATRLTRASLRLPLSRNIPEGRARGALLKVNSTNEDGPTQPLVWKGLHAGYQIHAGNSKDSPERNPTLVSSLDYYWLSDAHYRKILSLFSIESL